MPRALWLSLGGGAPEAPAAAAHSAISSTGPGTCSGTGTAYRPTALPTVAPYALPVPGFVPDAPAAAAHSAISRLDIWSTPATMYRCLLSGSGLMGLGLRI